MGDTHKCIDYYENNLKGVDHYAEIIKQRKLDCGYMYEYVNGNILCIGPHDLRSTHWESIGNSEAMARKYGLHFRVIPKMLIPEGIAAVRRIFPQLWIHEKACARLLECLSQYRYEWDEVTQCFSDHPVHDWASHGADMLRYYALSVREEPSYTPSTKATYAFDPWADQDAVSEFNPYAEV